MRKDCVSMKFLNQSIYELQFPLDDHEKYPLRVLKNGKWKQHRAANVDCYQDFEEVVLRSSHNKFNQANGSNIERRTWDIYFEGFYKRLPGITKYHHFDLKKMKFYAKNL
ncbi:hypothetical protein QE152_g39491 [Popillia japonica]|uniref:Uncharacterized protein n=1 Tax=Popillia japonica TaxID=7064 RepID=A0AAW1HTT6_POPJA